MDAYVLDAGAKLVGMGDIKQLQPVSAGGPFAALHKHTELPIVELTDVIRQKTEPTKKIVSDVRDKKASDALKTSYVSLPAIGTSKQRSSHAIARDIMRRLLPRYAELWQSTKVAIDDRLSALEMADHIEQLIIAAVEGHQRYNQKTFQSRELRRTVYFGSLCEFSGRGTVTYSGYSDQRVDININNLSLDFAIKLLNIYKKEKEFYERKFSTTAT